MLITAVRDLFADCTRAYVQFLRGQADEPPCELDYPELTRGEMIACANSAHRLVACMGHA